MIVSRFRLVLRSLARSGVWPTLRRIPVYVERQRKLRSFDARFHTRTSEVRPIDPEEADLELVRHSSTHMATPQEHFEKMLAALPVPARDLVFVDIGSGAGRVVLYASTLPFKRVIGIEISRRLHETAQSNVEIFRRAQLTMLLVELICGDATTVELPREDLLLYFHQPFDREMFQRMMQHLAKSLAQAPRRLFLIYYEPRHRDIIDECGLFELLVAHGEPGDAAGAWCIWHSVPAKQRRSA